MGLDMYLFGEVFFSEARNRGERRGEYYNLGYWRKHPNLHGYIVKTFADGEDDCQRIYFSAANIRQILAAIKAKELPVTEGFFFGESDGSEYEEDIRVFSESLDWLEEETPPNEWRDVYYQASW